MVSELRNTPASQPEWHLDMGETPTKPKPGYLEQALNLALTKDLTPGVHHVVVEHDNECPAINGGITCNCNPKVMLCEGSS